MRRAILALLLAAAPAWSAPRTYDLPDDTATLATGPNQEAAAQCMACHSPDYIATQPRRLPNPRAFWQAEVTKMKAAYGAPIEADDIPKIVDYLVQAYGE